MAADGQPRQLKGIYASTAGSCRERSHFLGLGAVDRVVGKRGVAQRVACAQHAGVDG